MFIIGCDFHLEHENGEVEKLYGTLPVPLVWEVVQPGDRIDARKLATCVTDLR